MDTHVVLGRIRGEEIRYISMYSQLEEFSRTTCKLFNPPPPKKPLQIVKDWALVSFVLIALGLNCQFSS